MVSHRGAVDAAPARRGALRPAGRWMLGALVLGAALLAGCGGGRRPKKVKLPPPINPRVGWTETGVASWYGHPYHGRRTSNGEVYDMNKMTAAHKRLPFNTWLRVRNLANGETTVVRVNDRGPFVGKRIIDLSRAAAVDIGMIGTGTARVRLTRIRPPGRDRAGDRNRPEPRRAGRFDIQAGVFSKRENAQSLVAKARRNGHEASVQELGQGAARQYRVVVRGGSLREANAKLQTLKSQGFEGFVRPRGS